jgi:sarcosine oxidase subunit alpha
MSRSLRQGTRLGTERFEFTFDGRRYDAQVGDTAASVLLANGVMALGRSVKYRRLRGLVAVGPEEPNALLTVGTTPTVIPNVSAPQWRLSPGVVARSQNRWPTLRWDLASLLQAGGGFFGAGFYYKTFIWPSWRTYESLIRRLAGLGEAPGACDLPVADTEYSSCDVLVAGGGPAGLAAALSAARAGARVVLVEREPVVGGELEFETATIEGHEALEWIERTRAELVACGVRILTETTLVGGTAGRYIAHHEPAGLPGHNRLYRILPKTLILSMGAVERPIAFIDNDRPGVMLLGAAERLVRRYGALAGRSAVIFANHHRAYAAALRLSATGIEVKAIVDTRAAAVVDADAMTSAHRRQLGASGTRCYAAHVVVAAEGVSKVTGARLMTLEGVAADTIRCDLILTSGGWQPQVHAGLQGGGTRRFDAAAAAFYADQQPSDRQVIGASRAIFGLAAVLHDGLRAGVEAARQCGFKGATPPAMEACGDGDPALQPYWRSPCRRSDEKRQFVDFQNDVTVADLRAALEEGFIDIEHVKRYTTLGVGTEQGRLGNALGAAILAELKGETPDEVGISRPRPPFHPVTMQALAGRRVGPQLRIARRTALHDWHQAHGGVLDPMGLWLRPRYYRDNGADAASAAIVEARRVREHGGIVDGSTLGKIEVVGADAAAYLDSVYLNKASTIRVGRSKYMVNLREDGMVLDDGIVLRLAPDRFIATTSSGHGEHMLSHFEHYRDLHWSGRSVVLTDITDAWSVIAVAGPTSRAALCEVLGERMRPLVMGLGHMDFVTSDYQGHALMVLRASFSGELAFELHVRPAGALGLWKALIAAGLKPYGIDALDILRVEKGYLVSSELNGQTTPHDLNMDALVRQDNPCVGRLLLDRPAFHEATRERLVGVRAADGRASFLAGAQLTTLSVANRSIGYVTSSVFSPTVNAWIGLALVARGAAIEGAVLMARDPLRDRETRVLITSPVHVDPTGERMKS